MEPRPADRRPWGDGPQRYFFRLHALDAELDVGTRAGRRGLESALSGRVLATAELMGTYERRCGRIRRS